VRLSSIGSEFLKVSHTFIWRALEEVEICSIDAELISIQVGSEVSDPEDRMKHGRATRLQHGGAAALLGVRPRCLMRAPLRWQKAFLLASRVAYGTDRYFPSCSVQPLEDGMVIETVPRRATHHYGIDFCAGVQKLGDLPVEQHRLQQVVKVPSSPLLFRLCRRPHSQQARPSWTPFSPDPLRCLPPRKPTHRRLIFRRIETKWMAVHCANDTSAHHQLLSHDWQEHQDALPLAPARIKVDCYLFCSWSLTLDVNAQAEHGSRTGAGGSTSMILWSSA
jgi:hypothetical protein